MKKKVRLIQCSAKSQGGYGGTHRCTNKAVIFPLTPNGILSRQKYCLRHWPKYKRHYKKWIHAPAGVIVGQLQHLIERLEDDESLEVFGEWDNFSGTANEGYNISITSSSTAGTNFDYSPEKKSIWRRIIGWLKDKLR